jgi:hypothetical protein
LSAWRFFSLPRARRGVGTGGALSEAEELRQAVHVRLLAIADMLDLAHELSSREAVGKQPDNERD